MDPLYFDNNATTPMDPRVVEAMSEALAGLYGNPSSPHPIGEEAHAAVVRARGSVARLLGARSPGEIVFTSGGTESANTAFHAILSAASPGKIATSPVEHPCVSRPLERWGQRGFELHHFAVEPSGRVDVEATCADLEAAAGELRLVSLQWANNETGALLEDGELARLVAAAKGAGAVVHVDAVQAAGKVPVDLAGLGIDLASFSTHKFHGPKGVGILYVRRELNERFGGLLLGGPQEEARRAGTPNVPGIVGAGRAAELALERVSPDARARLEARRDRFEAGLRGLHPGARIHGEGTPRLPNTTSVQLPGMDAELLLMGLAAAGVCASSGSACSSGRQGPSEVLLALGLPEEAARETLRFSLSHLTDDREVEACLERLSGALEDLGGLPAESGPDSGSGQEKTDSTGKNPQTGASEDLPTVPG